MGRHSTCESNTPAVHIPPTSSGLVSWRTKIKLFIAIFLNDRFNDFASNTILPTAAPGPAGRPLVIANAFFPSTESKMGTKAVQDHLLRATSMLPFETGFLSDFHEDNEVFPGRHFNGPTNTC